MKVLISVASKHGATEEIGREIPTRDFGRRASM